MKYALVAMFLLAVAIPTVAKESKMMNDVMKAPKTKMVNYSLSDNLRLVF